MTLVDALAYHCPTAEGRLLEAAMFLQALEGDDTFNTANPKPNKVNVQVNTDAKTATITATIPIEYTTNPIGGIIIYAKEYLITPDGEAVHGQP